MTRNHRNGHRALPPQKSDFWELDDLEDQGHCVQPHRLFQAGLHFGSVCNNFQSATPPAPTREAFSGVALGWAVKWT